MQCTHAKQPCHHCKVQNARLQAGKAHRWAPWHIVVCIQVRVASGNLRCQVVTDLKFECVTCTATTAALQMTTGVGVTTLRASGASATSVFSYVTPCLSVSVAE